MSLLLDKALGILQIKYPLHQFREEVSYYDIIVDYQKESKIDPFLLKRSKRLFADIYDKTNRTIYEIDGSQHYGYSDFFHKNIGDFESQQARDRIKKEIAKTIGAEMIILTEKDIKQYETNRKGNK